MKKTVLLVFLGLIVFYCGIGLVFHFGWQSSIKACREIRIARGEFVEPEWSPWITLPFTVTYWPVYAWANWYHFGHVFPPCPE
jgi:hypothetical protein